MEKVPVTGAQTHLLWMHSWSPGGGGRAIFSASVPKQGLRRGLQEEKGFPGIPQAQPHRAPEGVALALKERSVFGWLLL